MKLVQDAGPDRETTEPSQDRAVEDRLGRLAEQRGISIGVLDAAGIRTDDGGRHDGWWRIPYPHRTGIHKHRYRNPHPESQPKYLDDPGSNFHLYNPGLLGPGEDEVWFAEGEFDTLALIDQGLKAIGIHGVANVPDPEEPEAERGFAKEWKLLFQDTICVTMFDNDDAGRQAGRRLARGLDGEAFDEWDNTYKDANEWHKSDPDGLGVALNSFRSRIYSSKGMEPGW